MKTLTTFLFFIISFYTGYSQQTWTNYVNDRLIADIIVDKTDVWVASQGGLTRTNIQSGEFQTYLAGNSPIKGGGVSQIEKAPDGAIWIGSENGGVFRYFQDEWIHYYDDVVDSFYEEIEHLQILPNGDVWFFVEKRGNQLDHKLFRIKDGQVKAFGNLPPKQYSFCMLNDSTLYLLSQKAIYKYDVNTGTVIKTFDETNSLIESTEKMRDLRLDKNGHMIIPSDTRIFQLINDELTVLSQQGLTVLLPFSDEQGNIYFQTYHNDPNGVRLLKYDGNQFKYYTDQDFAPYPADDLPIFFANDIGSGLYAGIFNVDSEFTLFRYYDNEWYPVKSQIVPLLDNYQQDVEADCHGNLWFNSRDGIDVRYSNGSWEHFDVSNTFHSSSMTIDPITCDAWFGNYGGGGAHPGIIRISNGVVTSFLNNDGNIHDIKASRDGKIYFLSAESGFGYIENDEVTILDDGSEFTICTSMDIDSKGNVYIGAWQSKLIRYNGHSFDHLGSGEGGDYVFNVRVDRDDLIWTTSSNGLMQFDGVGWHNMNATWESVEISDMIQDKKGNFWVSTFNDGLFYWDGQNTQHYNILNSGLTTEELYKVNLDDDGNLIVTQWVGASVLHIPQVLEYFHGNGSVYFDAEKNGVFDPGTDVLVPGQKMKNLDNNLWSVTNAFGSYAFYNDVAEENQFQHQLQAAAQSTTPNPQTALFTDYASILPDFGFWTDEPFNVQHSINTGIMICDRDFNVQISFHNNGVYAITGDVVLNYADLYTYVSSSLPPTEQAPGQIMFDDLSLAPFEYKYIKVTFKSPDFTSLGMVGEFESAFQTTDTILMAATSDSLHCSYDPNDKKVEATGDFFEHTSLISDPLKYTIRFQNEGNYKAFDIVVLDTLDANLDPSTFELVASSHPVEVTISPEGILKFVFSHIDLPARSENEAESQGFVSFTIQPDSNLVSPLSIFNKASIYFDFNPPIQTNTTAWDLTDDLASVGIQEPKSNFILYPNPTDGHLIIEMDNESSYRILDASGRAVNAGYFLPGRNNIEFNGPAGLYIIHVIDVNGRRIMAKVIKL